MDDRIGKIQVFPDHFQPSTTPAPSSESDPRSPPHRSPSPGLKGSLSSHKKFTTAVSVLELFSSRGNLWGSDSQDKVQLSAAELEALQLEIANLEKREAHAKAQLEHVDKLLQSARLSGYLCIRTRWEALPGELPPVDDDTDIDDRLPRFVVLHGAYISPQDSFLLSDITEIGPRPSFIRGGEEMMHSFYILTNHGLQYECSCASNVRVSNWLRALQVEYNQLPEKRTLST